MCPHLLASPECQCHVSPSVSDSCLSLLSVSLTFYTRAKLRTQGDFLTHTRTHPQHD